MTKKDDAMCKTVIAHIDDLIEEAASIALSLEKKGNAFKEAALSGPEDIMQVHRLH